MNHQHLVDGDPGGGRDSCRSRGGSRLLAAVDLRFILVRRRLDLVSPFVPVSELLHQCLNVGFQGENPIFRTGLSAEPYVSPVQKQSAKPGAGSLWFPNLLLCFG